MKTFKRLLLCAALAAGCAFGKMTVSGFFVPTIAPGIVAGVYEIWIRGGDVDTAAYRVSVKYEWNSQSFVESMVTGSTGDSFYSALAVLRIPPDAHISSIVVTQLKPVSSQEFTQ